MTKNFLFGNLTYLLLLSMFHNHRCIQSRLLRFIHLVNIMRVNVQIIKLSSTKIRVVTLEELGQKVLPDIYLQVMPAQ